MRGDQGTALLTELQKTRGGDLRSIRKVCVIEQSRPALQTGEGGKKKERKVSFCDPMRLKPREDRRSKFSAGG